MIKKEGYTETRTFHGTEYTCVCKNHDIEDPKTAALYAEIAEEITIPLRATFHLIEVIGNNVYKWLCVPKLSEVGAVILETAKMTGDFISSNGG